MITHKIEPPLMLLPPVTHRSGMSRGSAYGTQKCPWDKLTYGKWIEQIKATFKIGDKICLNHTSRYTDELPFLYEIVDIGEIHYMVDFDVEYREPMCLHVVTEMGFRMAKCPASIRKLTFKEEALVYLRDKNNKVVTP